MNLVGREQYKLPDDEDVGNRRHFVNSLALFVKKQQHIFIKTIKFLCPNLFLKGDEGM